MAQFSYENYEAKQASKKSSSGQGTGTKTHFVNEYLKNDGDSVVVRFPYHSMADVNFETTHTVTFPGDKYGKRVRCSGDACPLCEQGVKVDTRFFVKAIVYVPDATGSISLVPAIWDRPAAFADIDLKNLMTEYGDITESLFKIKRSGTGLDTRYSIMPIMNKTVYNPEVYKADFSVLEGLDPTRILTKTIEQYTAALNPESKAEETTVSEEAVPVSKTAESTTPVTEDIVHEEVKVEAPAPAPAAAPATQSRPTNRYTF